MLDTMREGIQNRSRTRATVAMKDIWVVTLWCIVCATAIFYIGMWLCAKTNPNDHTRARQLLGKLKCWVILGYELMHFEILYIFWFVLNKNFAIRFSLFALDHKGGSRECWSIVWAVVAQIMGWVLFSSSIDGGVPFERRIHVPSVLRVPRLGMLENYTSPKPFLRTEFFMMVLMMFSIYLASDFGDRGVPDEDEQSVGFLKTNVTPGPRGVSTARSPGASMKRRLQKEESHSTINQSMDIDDVSTDGEDPPVNEQKKQRDQDLIERVKAGGGAVSEPPTFKEVPRMYREEPEEEEEEAEEEEGEEEGEEEYDEDAEAEDEEDLLDIGDEEEEVDEGLPKDWAATVDPNSGDTYYYNVVTYETCWLREEIPGIQL